MIGKENILKIFKESSATSFRAPDIKRKLGVKPQDVKKLRSLLKELVDEGKLIHLRKKVFTLPVSSGLISGFLRVHPKGFGFVLSLSDQLTEYYIHRENMSSAMHGDQVLIQIINSNFNRKGIRTHFEGRIIKILERGNPNVIGTLFKGRKSYYVVPDNSRLIQDIWISDIGSATPGDKVQVQITQWPNNHLNPEGEIIKVFGRSDDPIIDFTSILAQYGWKEKFPSEVEDEAVHGQASKDLALRKDLRNLDSFTIDPDDARDFDDAISIQKEKDGWLVGIHIADVSHYVQAQSLIDQEAERRANTIYFIDRTIRMLPEKLTWDVCSLTQERDSLSKSLMIHFNQYGKILNWKFYKSIIRSKKRFNYDEVNHLLKSKSNSLALGQSLFELKKLSTLLHNQRVKLGAIDLSFPDVKFLMDEGGMIKEIKPYKTGVSHRMVEECMLLANHLIGELMLKKKYPCIFRIHEPPEISDLKQLWKQLQKFNVPLPRAIAAESLQNIAQSVQGTKQSYVAQLTLLKSLKQARYSTSNKGHFALALPAYIHFTSPIRRYTDLRNHQSLDYYHFKQGQQPNQTLSETANHCSIQERIAEDAEREYLKIKRLRFLNVIFKKQPRRSFDAIITDVKEFGLFVQENRYLVDGLVHISDLSMDFFLYDENKMMLIGRRSRKKYRLGDGIKVSIDSIDMLKKQIRFKLA